MGISLAEINVGDALKGAGQFFKDIRTALTGKEPLDANKAAELALKAQEMETTIETTRLSVMVAEASSADKWTSRARPMFMYVFYSLVICLVIIAPFVGVFFPVQMQQFYANVGAGFKAIPDIMWETFGVGYLGYSAARSWDKNKSGCK